MEVCFVQMAYPSLLHCMVLTYFYSSEPIPGRPNLDFSYSDDAASLSHIGPLLRSFDETSFVVFGLQKGCIGCHESIRNASCERLCFCCCFGGFLDEITLIEIFPFREFRGGVTKSYAYLVSAS